MDINEAKEIYNSLGYVDVVYGESSVWIEDLDEENKMAKVKILETEEMKEIPISDLKQTVGKL